MTSFLTSSVILILLQLILSPLNPNVATTTYGMFRGNYQRTKKAYSRRLRPVLQLPIHKLPPYEIEQLELSKRTENCFLRAGITDFYLLTELTFEDALCIKNLSPVTLSELVAVLHKKSDLINSALSSKLVDSSDYQFLRQMGVPLGNISVSRLVLPTFLERILKFFFNIETVETLASLSEAKLKAILGVNSDEYIRILTKNLETYFTWLPTQNNWDDEIADQGISPIYLFQLKETTLEKIVDALLNQYLCQLGSINTANLSDISEYLGNKNGLRHLRKQF